MNTSEAQRVVAMMQAAWPRPTLAGSTVAAWVGVLSADPADAKHAMTAVRELARLQKFMPQPSEVLDAAEEVRRDMTPSLPAGSQPLAVGCSFTEFLSARPDMLERVKKLGIWREFVETAEARLMEGTPG